MLTAAEAADADPGRQPGARLRSTRTAPGSSRPSWPADWPTSSNASASTIYEQTPVTAISRRPGRDPARGAARAGDPARHRGIHRADARAAPALAADEQRHDRHRADAGSRLWDSIGWDGCETLGDLAHGFFYAQRTADDRIAIGGRARALPLRLPHRPRRRRRPGHHRPPDRRAEHRAAADPRRADRARLVRRAGGAAGLDGRRATSTRPPASARPAATSATASPPPTSPGARWPIWCSSAPRRLTALPWVGHRSTSLGTRTAALARRARPLHRLQDWPTGTKAPAAHEHLADRRPRRPNHRTPLRLRRWWSARSPSPDR